MTSGRPRRLFPLLALMLGFAIGLGWWLVQGEELLAPDDAMVDNSTLVVLLSESSSYQSAVAAAEGAVAPTEPEEVSLPTVTVDIANAATQYFGGVGAPLLEFVGAVEGTWGGLDEQFCDDLTARLEEVSPPSELMVFANQVPDDAARDTLANLVSFTVRHVAVCGADDSSIASEVAWHWAVAARRLAQLGVRLP